MGMVIGKDRCETCKYYVDEDKALNIKQMCRRYPPVYLGMKNGVGLMFGGITVRPNGWCGEHSPKITLQ
jgi:hypothetical protein